MLAVSQKSLAGVSQTPTPDASHEAPCTYLALLIVNANAVIQNSFWNGSHGASLKTTLCDTDTTLRPDLATIVTDLIAHQNATNSESIVVLRDGGRTLRLSPLAGGPEGLSVLVMEADRYDGVLARATSRYHLTRRQAEVLALVLEGASASDVAHALVISEYTAQGYVKSLLAKTDSRNRAAMVAKVLNWNESREARDSRSSVPGRRAAFG